MAALLCCFGLAARGGGFRLDRASLGAGLLLAALLLGYGGWRLAAHPLATEPQGPNSLDVLFVEGNVDQNQKWIPAFQRQTVDLYLDLTYQALAQKPQARPLIIWPETAMLRARLMAEQMQQAFKAQAADQAEMAGGAPQCAIGIACASQGGRTTPESLLQKAEKALREAQAQKRGHICVSESAALDARGTLVHSSEKRFLFFGGN